MNCRVCNSKTTIAFTEKVLKKYSAPFSYCEKCGFLGASNPYWLDEAHQNSIADIDTGIITRNVASAKVISSLIYFALTRQGKYVDIAGGYGLLTRLMRDCGYDFYWSDKYSQNLFARNFAAPESPQTYTALTALEVLEHVVNPIEFIHTNLTKYGTKTMIFSTTLFAGAPPEKSWWYYCFESGQHISFYQKRTLKFIAEQLGLNLYSNNTFHMITNKKISPTAFVLYTTPRFVRYLSPILSKILTSKTQTDHYQIKGL